MNAHDPAQHLTTRYAPLLQALEAGTLDARVADVRIISIPGTEAPWRDTGIALDVGDAVTILGMGRVTLSDELNLTMGAHTHLWRRIGSEGDAVRAPSATYTHTADRSGHLYLGISPGAWTSRRGDHHGIFPLDGGFAALVIRWHADPRDGLRAVERLVPGDGPLRTELQRLEHPLAPPAGWTPLWYVGASALFGAATENGRPIVRTRSVDDVGIVKYPVDLPLTEATQLDWAWCVRRLPARTAEDQLQHHDYVSIALEFENGQDLTYYWSAALAIGTSFRCPIPWWDQRETHIVVRSGADGLGTWQHESRGVRADYAAAVGDPPTRIVGVWLIGVSCFTHGHGHTDFADIVLRDDTTRVVVT